MWFIFQANKSKKSQYPATKGLASSFGFKKPTQTNKIRPISAPAKSIENIEKSDSRGSKMSKPTSSPMEKCSRNIPKTTTPSPNRFGTAQLLICKFQKLIISFLGLDSVNQLQNLFNLQYEPQQKK